MFHNFPVFQEVVTGYLLSSNFAECTGRSACRLWCTSMFCLIFACSGSTLGVINFPSGWTFGTAFVKQAVACHFRWKVLLRTSKDKILRQQLHDTNGTFFPVASTMVAQDFYTLFFKSALLTSLSVPLFKFFWTSTTSIRRLSKRLLLPLLLSLLFLWRQWQLITRMWPMLNVMIALPNIDGGDIAA